MDSLTQITLGAAIGEVTMGRRCGNKAVFWGAVIGTLPDLDCLASPFLSTVQTLSIHRSFTHSLLFCIIIPPILGKLISRIHNDQWWKRWSLLAFLVILTHLLLDSCTTYGTQIFQPFSNYRLAVSNISIIDPIFTIPMLISLICSLFMAGKSLIRKRIVIAGLVLSCGYLAMTLANKVYVRSIFRAALDEQKISYQQFITKPAPLTNFLWRCVAMDDGGFWEGYYSIFDGDKDVHFRYLEKNHGLIKAWHDDPGIKTLQWVTGGYFSITVSGTKNLLFNDMRYGKIDAWNKGQGNYIFSYKIDMENSKSSRPLAITEVPRSMRMTKESVQAYFRRVGGRD